LPPILRSRGVVDGVILGGVNYPNLEERVRAEGIPYSIFGNNLVDRAEIDGNAVLFDDVDGAEQAVEHLLRLGHRKIWFVGDVSWPWNRRRFDRFTAVMERAGLEPRAITAGLARAGHELGMRAARAILDSHPCTAIFAASDYIACGVIEAAQQIGRKVPGDLSVIGFDALDEFVYYRPAITTIGTDKEKIGEHCARLLIQQVESQELCLQPNVSVPMHLVERESCAPLETIADEHKPARRRRIPA
jgi:LacI family transcriptional regulator, galactose operon repressor